jgi:hypothetical protein
MSKFKEITREDKIQKSMKIQKLSCFKPAHHCRANYPIIDNISLSYNLVEHYVYPFLPKKKEKKEIEIDVKGFTMLDVQSMENLSKKLPIFIVKFSLILFFYC